MVMALLVVLAAVLVVVVVELPVVAMAAAIAAAAYYVADMMVMVGLLLAPGYTANVGLENLVVGRCSKALLAASEHQQIQTRRRRSPPSLMWACPPWLE